jgi:hypothetical protein
MRAQLLVGAALLLAGAQVHAQTAQTWVSGDSGDDANPCLLEAPCATFAAAYSVTTAGGEIDVLDPGDFGPLTIEKAITIDGHCGALTARVDASGGPIVVNAGAADVVVLRGLAITGGGVGTTGINFIAGGALQVEDSSLAGFAGDAIDFSPATGASLTLQDVVLHENGGAGLSFSSGGATLSTAVISGGTSEANSIGYRVGTGGKATIYRGSIWGNLTAGVSTDGTGDVNLEDVAVANNAIGLSSSSSSSAVIRASNLELAPRAGGSCTQITGGGVIQTFVNNAVACPACAIATSGVAGAIAGVAYPPLPFTLNDAVGTVLWTETGPLPSGLTFNNGTLSGTPVGQGTFPFSVAANNGGNCSASANYSLVVVCPSDSIDPAAAPDAITGVAYGPVTFTQTGAAGAASLILTGTLPIGMTFSAGVLSGMPTEIGSFPLTIAATDAAGCGATASFALAVAAGAGFQATALALGSSANPSDFKAPVALTATIAGGAGTPSGSVTFFDGTTQLGSPATVSGRTASINAAFNTLGAHSLSMLYSGDAVFGGGRAALTQSVSPAATSVALTSTSAAGVELGSPVSFTAAVTSLAGTPGGNVEFLDGTASLGVVALDGSGSASVTTSALGVGSHAISVMVPASTNFAASTANLAQTVNPHPTSVLLTSSNASGVEFGHPVTFTAAVSSASGSPGGDVELFDGTASLGVVVLNGSGSASVTTSALGVGSHAISVNVPASTNFAASTASLTQTVLPLQVLPAASFTVAAGLTTATLSTISLAVYPLTVTVNGTLGSPITFACAGLPAGATCSFSPASVTASTALTLTVSNGGLASRTPATGSPLAAMVLLPGLLFGGIFTKRRIKPGMLACLALATIAFGSTACTKGASVGTTSQFTVVATSGSLQQTTSLQLVVR